MQLSRVRPSDMFYVVVALLASAPAWIVRYPPMMDLPFHLATIRIVHDIHNPAFGLDHDFVLTLGRTQYVLYYLVGSLLAYVVGVVNANIVLMSSYFAGTVLAMRTLLRALRRDERLCLLVVPLLTNAMLLYGLLPFLLGIPLMLWALAKTVRWFDHPECKKTGVTLAALALALFYSHIFPFLVFGLGFAAMFPWKEPRRWVRAALPPVPALLTMGFWTLFTDAGRLTRAALTDSGADHRKSLAASLADLHMWLTDVFQDSTDETIFVAFLLLALLSLGLSLGDRDKAHPSARAYALLPIACVVLYFTCAEGHGYIWLIAQRFPILALITGLPIVRSPAGWRGQLVASSALVLATAATINTCRHFVAFQLDEVGDIDEAIAQMRPKAHVCALIYDRASHRVINPQWAPFLHFGSYYQAQRGGVVMFTYAGYAHWPVDFRPGHYPPPGTPARPRWEWTPEQVNVSREVLPYYDYVLTRGEGFRPPPGTFRLTWSQAPWSVWERVTP